MVISLATTYQPANQFPYPRTDIAQTSHRYRTDMCSMYDVGRITSKPHSVGGLPNSESGLEIQPVARATGQGGVAETFARHLRTFLAVGYTSSRPMANCRSGHI